MSQIYRVGIVGESFRQAAVRRCEVGDEVLLLPDPGNAYDPRAIAVFARDELIGYLPRDGWLTRAILDEDKDVAAEIFSITPGGGGNLGIVLEVTW